MATWLAKLARRLGTTSQGRQGRKSRRRGRAPFGVPVMELLESRLAPTISVTPGSGTITFTGNADGDSLYLNETTGGKLIYSLTGPSGSQVTTNIATGSLTVNVNLPGSSSSSVGTLTLGNRWSFDETLSYTGNSGDLNVLVGPTTVAQNTWRMTGYAAGTLDTSATFSGVGTIQGDGNDILKGEVGGATWNVDLRSGHSLTYVDGGGSVTFSGMVKLWGRDNGGNQLNTFNFYGDSDTEQPTLAVVGGGGSNTFNVYGTIDLSAVTLDGAGGNSGAVSTLNFDSSYASSDLAPLTIQLSGQNSSETIPHGYDGTQTNSGGLAAFYAIDAIGGTGSGSDLLYGLTNAFGTWHVNTAGTYATTVNSNTATLNFSGFGYLQGGDSGNHFYVDGATSDVVLGGLGTDTLDFSGYGSGVGVTLTDSDASYGMTGGVGGALGSFSAINTLIGHSGSSLTGNGSVATGIWALGTTNTYNDGTATLTFSAFATVTDASTASATFNVSGVTDVTTANGNAVANTFNVTGNNTGTLTLNGGAGTDKLDYTGYSASALTVILNGSTHGYASASATGLAGFSAIDTLVGAGNATDELRGEALGSGHSTWTLGTTNQYTDNAGNGTLTFSAFGVVTDRGTTADTFNVTGATAVKTANANGGGDTFNVDVANTGLTLNGGAGSDTLDYAAYNAAPIAATLSQSTTNGYDGSVSGLAHFTGMDVLTGTGSATDSLTGEAVTSPAVSTWALGSTNTYSDGNGNGKLFTFSAIKVVNDAGTTHDVFNVSGATDVATANANNSGDTFNVTGAAPGLSVVGGTGSDTLSYASYGSPPVTITLSSSGASGFTGTATGLNGFSAIDTVVGVSASGDTLNGYAAASGHHNTWALTSPSNTYTDGSGDSLSFSGFKVVNDAGTTADVFNVSGVTDVATANANSGGDTFNVTANNGGTLTLNGGSGTDKLDYTGYSASSLSVVLSASTANGYASTSATGLAGFSAIDTLKGAGNANDTLTGEAVTSPAVNTWALGASNTYKDGNAGNVTLTFSAFKAVQDAGSTHDVFTITAGTDVTSATANTGGDTFNVNGANAGLALTGGSGSDTLTYAAYGAPPVTVTLTTSTGNGYTGTGTGLAGFTGMDVLAGSSNSGDLLKGEALGSGHSTWALGSTNTYTDNTGNGSLTFSAFATVTDQGSTADVFNVSGATDVATANANTGGDTFNVSGAAGGLTVNGSTGSDTLSYASYSGAVTATLTQSTANGYNGSATGLAAFNAIDVLTANGNAGSTLNGEAVTSPAVNTWALGGTNTYNDGGSKTLTFSGFKVVQDAGSTHDVFTVTAGTDVASASANGGGDTFNVNGANAGLTLNGGAGSDTLTYAAYGAPPITVTLTGSTASGYGGTATGLAAFTAIDTLIGTSNASDSLLGESVTSPAVNTWALGSTNTYKDGNGNNKLLTFAGFANVTDTGTTHDVFNVSGATDVASANANSGGDTFNVSGAAGGLTVNGNLGSDTLSYASYGAPPVTVTLLSSTANGYSGNATGLAFVNGINVLAGSSNAGDLLKGEALGSGHSTWALGSTNTYTDNTGNGSLTFSAFATVTDQGSTADVFNVSGSTDVATANANTGGDTFNVSGAASGLTVHGNTGSDTLSYASYGSPPVTATLATSAASGYSGTVTGLAGFTAIDKVVGSGAAGDTLKGEPLSSGASTWTLTNPTNSYADGSGNTLSFSGFKVVTDQGTTQDTFNVTGATDVATANANGAGDTFNVDAANAGLTLNGGAGSDTLTYAAYGAPPVTVVLSGSANGYASTSATGLAGFSAIDTLVGSSNAGDILKGESLSSGHSTWALAGTNTYSDGGSSTLTFSAFKTVCDRGTTADTFNITGVTTVATANANGGGDTFNLNVANTGLTLNGGSGSDTLTYASYGTPPVLVTLTGSSANGYASTSATGLAAFSAIDVLTGSGNGSDVLTGENVASTWVLGNTLTYNDGGTPNLTFSAFLTLQGGNAGNTFEVTANNTLNLIGGTGADVFRLPVNGVQLTGTVNGGGGGDTLSYAAFGGNAGYTNATVDLYANDATGISGNISNLATFVGGAGTGNTLNGPLGNGSGNPNVWSISSTNGGSIANNGGTLATFAGFQNLVGAPGVNTFKFTANNVGVGGSITGGSTADTIDYSAVGSAVTFNVGAAGLNNSGTVSTGTAPTYTFYTIGNLTGGSGNNTFNMSPGRTLAGNLNGGVGGVNTLSYSTYTTSVRVILGSNAATGVGGTLTHIKNVTGGYGNDILIGDGTGNTLTGGGGSDVLVGRGGNAKLIASPNANGTWGNNILIGGNGVGSLGHATLQGGNGQDILIAGTTSYDTNITALNALMAEWSLTSVPFATRVSYMNGTLSGGRNGAYVLTASTVQKSNGGNTLTGGTLPSPAALDWFFVSAGDTVNDSNTGKKVTTL